MRRFPAHALGRRAALLALGALASCGSILPERPYEEKRAWPLVVRRPEARPPRKNGRVLLVRSLQAGPGMEVRGLQTLQPDGSVKTAFYEEWAVPPVEAVESSLRQWLADSGLFAAVVAPGSRLAPELVLEGTLTTMIADPAAGHARVAIAYVLIDQRSAARVLLQRNAAADAPLHGAQPAAIAAATRQALAECLQQIEKALARYA